MRNSVLEGLKQRRLADIQVETEEMVDWSEAKAESCAPGEKDRKSCVSSA